MGDEFPLPVLTTVQPRGPRQFHRNGEGPVFPFARAGGPVFLPVDVCSGSGLFTGHQHCSFGGRTRADHELFSGSARRSNPGAREIEVVGLSSP